MPTENSAYRSVTDDDKDAIVKQLGGGVAEVFGFASDLFTDRPGFIASTDDRAPLAEAVRSISQFNCRRWAAADKSNFSTNVNVGNANLCNPYLESIGELPPDGDIGTQQEGGFCAGTTYALRAGANFQDYLDGTALASGSQPFGDIGGVTFAGPITAVSKEPRTFGTTGLPQSWRLRIISGAGTVRLIDISPTDRPPVGGRTERRVTSFRTQFVRVGGAPDTCAPPPSQIKPPGFNPYPGLPPNITVDIPGFGPTTVTVTPGPDGLPTICLVELDVCIDPNLGEPGPPDAGTPGPPPGGGEPGSPGTATPGAPAEDEAPEGKMLWGLRIDLDVIPPSAKQYAAGVYRGVCYVYMGDDDGLDHDPAGAMLTDGQFVLAERDYLTRWRVVANDGYNLTVTPYYKDKEA